MDDESGKPTADEVLLEGEHHEGDDEEVSVDKPRTQEIKELSNSALFQNLLGQIDEALVTFDTDTYQNKHMETEYREELFEMIKVLQESIDIPREMINDANIRIKFKTSKPEDDERLEAGEDVGVFIEVEIPGQNKVIMVNIWGSRLDYDSSKQFRGYDQNLVDSVADNTRTVNLQVFRKTHPSHGSERTRLEHNLMYQFSRSNQSQNRLMVLRFDGVPYQHGDRPQHLTDPVTSRLLNSELFRITDEFYERREGDQ